MKPKDVQKYSLIAILVGVLVGMIGTETHVALCVIGIIIMFAGLILHVVKYRCPHCNAYLGRSPVPHYCPCCGKEIEK